MIYFFINIYKKILNMTELVKFWFSNEQLWFNCSKDEDDLIHKKFYILLNDIIDFNNKGKDYILHNIILYDQLVRHFYRGKNMPEYTNFIALKFSKIMIENTELFHSLNPVEQCFTLMPYRHTFEKKNIEFVLGIIKKLRNDDISNKYYQRFYYATINSLVKINNEIAFNNPYDKMTIFPHSILDEKCKFDLKLGYIVNRTVLHKYKKLINNFRNLILCIKGDIILSISGGVDSMVCSYIMKYLDINFKCFMINYGNRKTSNMEVHMVHNWTKLLNVPLYVRNISEIKRSRDKDRVFYETITKNIRYDMYKLLGTNIILGHNKDDTVENIFTNISKNQHYDNLFGMNPKSQIDELVVLRPMLDIEKKQIFDFANDTNIPYLYDSTPSWSERGKIRDILVPNVNKVNQDIIPGLCNLSNYMTELCGDFKNMILKETIIKCNEDKREIYIEKCNYFSYIYWNIIFQKLSRLYSLPHISTKSINNFILILKKNGENKKFILHKRINGKIFNNKIIIYY